MDEETLDYTLAKFAEFTTDDGGQGIYVNTNRAVIVELAKLMVACAKYARQNPKETP